MPPTSGREPTAKLASDIAERSIGSIPAAVKRFKTGSRHYVFEARFSEIDPVVVRIGNSTARSEIEGAIYLSNFLRPLGVPLPKLLAHDSGAEFPWLVLERLPGADLGVVIHQLGNEQLDNIATQIAHAQDLVSKTNSKGKYGYAVKAENAPYAAWTDVLNANLDRSRKRIEAAGLFNSELVDIVQSEVTSRRAELDKVGATPFLHDTTTKNVIVTPAGIFSGIVDVDDLCFGDSRYPAALTKAALLSRESPTTYVSDWLKHARQAEDENFRLYVSLFLLDLMAEHGQSFNGNEIPSTPKARAILSRAFTMNQPQ